MGMVADMEVDKVVDKVADMVADIEVDKVANMKVDKVADMAVDMFKTKCIKCEMCIVHCTFHSFGPIHIVHCTMCIGPKL